MSSEHTVRHAAPLGRLFGLTRGVYRDDNPGLVVYSPFGGDSPSKTSGSAPRRRRRGLLEHPVMQTANGAGGGTGVRPY